MLDGDLDRFSLRKIVGSGCQGGAAGKSMCFPRITRTVMPPDYSISDLFMTFFHSEEEDKNRSRADGNIPSQ